MSYPTPMDVAQAEDRDADLSPSERLANICAALEEDLNESPFTREEWERMDAERLELLAANDGLAARLSELEKEAVTINNGFNAAVARMEQSETRLAALATRCKEHEQFRHQHRNCDRLALENRKLKALLSEVLAADKYDWNMGLEDRIREALTRRSKNK